MIKSFVYIEKDLKNHPRALRILEKYKATPIWINHYGEIFNHKSQHFRKQKPHQALILAKKHNALLHKVPEGYGIGNKHNYYFSHMLNCPFDCDYCFLQGMYRSAHFVHFVNFEDFQNAIKEKINKLQGLVTFFSGYDGDSLAMEGSTQFLQNFIPFFAQLDACEMEVRTKSISIRPLMQMPATKNAIIAYSLNPDIITKTIEKKTPTLHLRLQAIKQLQNHGWKIGLRFDPVLYIQDAEAIYSEFFSQVFQIVDLANVHSVTLGGFRMPHKMEKTLQALRPKDPLIASYQPEKFVDTCKSLLYQYVDKQKVYVCQ